MSRDERYFAGGATETPRAPVFSIARATSPDAFASSTTRHITLRPEPGIRMRLERR